LYTRTAWAATSSNCFIGGEFDLIIDSVANPISRQSVYFLDNFDEGRQDMAEFVA
jgi:hypothetical protein